MNRWDDNPWPKYVPVAERQRGARQAIATLAKKGAAPAPVVITGRAIATTFWGKGWCNHLERFSDYENRLPRGRSYVRSGAVVDLRVGPGRVDARVRGTSLYQASVVIAPLGKAAWREIVRACAGKVDSLVELLQGRFDQAVMQIVGRAAGGLFPEPAQLTMSCSCPDWASLCKHLAAVLYGVGARLDARPELLFTLRGVDPTDLVASAPSSLASSAKASTSRRLDADSLADVFGIELEGAAPPKPAQPVPAKKAPAAAKASSLAKVKTVAKAQRARDLAQPASRAVQASKARRATKAKPEPDGRQAKAALPKASASKKIAKASRKPTPVAGRGRLKP
jgi:uncharacterized Zn finger protein